MYNSLNVDLLYVFITVAKTKNISKSSKILSLSQPAISKKIHQLEEHFQVSLFVRSSRGVVLTSDGQDFYQQAIKVLHDFDSLYNVKKSDLNAQFDKLNIGANNSATLLYPSFFSELLFDQHQLILTNNLDELIEKFNYGSLDIVFINDFSENKFTTEHEKYTLYSEPYYVVYSQTNPYITSPDLSLTANELRGVKFILHPEYSFLIPQIRSTFQKADLLVPEIRQVNCFDFINYLISRPQTNLTTILPKFLAKHYEQISKTKLTSKKLALPKHYEISVISNGKYPLTALIQKLKQSKIY
ncbi:MAG TPA: LysR family transcriptional regulator [Lactobacillus sp.]|uniref:LysR family transcriptional regulator n=1 Tax=Ligilactobacillus murinus TaxID=1622 RepID=UPI00096CDF2D|nr:LysR family transcriptional regulator [Ligilactobacillus murinus]HAB49648.1 LysR family transcriptional regulator [Lactobacillus sp.]HAP23530.1 LysR family transcriptional regulator [Lactobacillus sp.]